MRKKWMVTGTSLMMTAALAITGCSGGGGGKTNEQKPTAEASKVQFPLEKPVQLKVFASKQPQVGKDYNEMQMIKELKKLTNVDVSWTLVDSAQLTEKKNITIASGDLPDAFFGNGVLTDQEVVKLGIQGGIIPLEGLIETHAPNFMKILQKRPELKKQLTAADGHIYSLPNFIEREYNLIPSTLFINKKWLDQLGLPLPSTIDEFYNTLRAFKEKDPNGNGKSDEIPFSFLFNNQINGSNSFAGAFGVKMDPPTNHLYVDNGKLKYAPAQPEYEAYLQFMSKLYKEHLLDQEVFTHNQNAYTTKIKSKEAQVGAYFGFTIRSTFGVPESDYVPLPPLKGTNGERGGWLRVAPGISKGSFAITSANKQPEITMKWMDTMYDEKLSFQLNGGPFGVTLKENADGTMEKIPTPQGMGEDIFKHTEAPGNGAVVIILKDILSKFIDPNTDDKHKLYDIYDAYAQKETIPSTLWSPEDVEKAAPMETDLHAKNGYYDSMFGKFVMNGFTHADWENHLAQLKKLKIDEYVALQQKYYDAYMAKK